MVPIFHKYGFLKNVLLNECIKMAIHILDHIWWDFTLKLLFLVNDTKILGWWALTFLLRMVFPRRTSLLLRSFPSVFFFSCFFLPIASSLFNLDEELLCKESEYDLLFFIHDILKAEYDLLFSWLFSLSELLEFSCYDIVYWWSGRHSLSVWRSCEMEGLGTRLMNVWLMENAAKDWTEIF